jgi:hypothetical protein
VVDRHGNREILYRTPGIDAVAPSPLSPRAKPPVIPSVINKDFAKEGKGIFSVNNVYEGLGDAVAPGEVKYLQVFQEVKDELDPLPDGGYQQEYNGSDYYASPVLSVKLKTWPTYIVKATPGMVPVNPDGSVSFEVPTDRMLYFSVLDKNYNEIQRMRSIVHIMPGESRSCIGCHESRVHAPPVRPSQAMHETPKTLTPPPWGTGAFSYTRNVQPIFDRSCVSCHAGEAAQKGPDLRGTLDTKAIPESWKSLILGGFVNYFDMQFTIEHSKAEPKTFGALKSKLANVLDKSHHDVSLKDEERLAIKTWIAMNCPLWGDYRPITERIAELKTQTHPNKEKAQ